MINRNAFRKSDILLSTTEERDINYVDYCHTFPLVRYIIRWEIGQGDYIWLQSCRADDVLGSSWKALSKVNWSLDQFFMRLFSFFQTNSSKCLNIDVTLSSGR